MDAETLSTYHHGSQENVRLGTAATATVAVATGSATMVRGTRIVVAKANQVGVVRLLALRVDIPASLQDVIDLGLGELTVLLRVLEAVVGGQEGQESGVTGISVRGPLVEEDQLSWSVDNTGTRQD